MIKISITRIVAHVHELVNNRQSQCNTFTVNHENLFKIKKIFALLLVTANVTLFEDCYHNLES